MGVINGTNNPDTLTGTAGNDTIYGKDGGDTISGLGGKDSLHGDKGNDVLYGDDGNDNLYGKDGDDWLYGGAGNDNLFGDGGRDVLFGETGNDVMKGGAGTSFMYGDGGNDSFFYNPYKGKIGDAPWDLAESYLEGGTEYDVLNIFNETTYTDGTGQKQNGWTYIGLDQNGTGFMYYEGLPGDWEAPWAHIGTFSGMEEIKVEGKGGLKFYGSDFYGVKVTGTDQGDDLISFGADDHLLGGGGNDYFFFNAGDKIESWTKDADEFYFADFALGGTATLKGFNGAGQTGGDVLTMSVYELGNPATQITESGGKTTFTLNSGDALQVDAVGLQANLDYFIV